MPANIWVVIPSAGKGTRFGAEQPKQYLTILDKTILEHTVDRFLYRTDIKGIIVVVSPNDFADAQLLLNEQVSIVTGGETRADSVMNALVYLAAIASADDLVAVHDAARPCVRQSSLDRLFKTAQVTGGAILATPAIDTIKWVKNTIVEKTLDREYVYQAQTPQVFSYSDLFKAMQAAKDGRYPMTDESSAIEQIGLTSHIVLGNSDNIKITQKSDLVLAEAYLSTIKQECD